MVIQGSYEIDDVDAQIIDLLVVDGRASFATIGQAVALSPDAVRARMARLTGDGVLRVMGFVHPGSLGYRSLGAVTLEFTGPADALQERLREHRSVTFAAHTVGSANALCEIAAHDDAEFADVIASDLATMPNVTVRDVWRHLQVVKWDSQARPNSNVPGAPVRAPRDEIDVQLLERLVLNPRATYRELEAETGHPYSVVRRRTRSLFDDGVVHASAIIDRVSTQHEVRAHLTLQMTGDWNESLERLVEVDDLKILVLTTGRDNATGEIASASPEGLVEAMRRLSAVPGVENVRSYLYARILVLPRPWRF